MEMLLLLFVLYLETVAISTVFASLGVFKIVKNIYQKRYKLNYKDAKECKNNLSISSFKDLLIPFYNILFSGIVFGNAYFNEKLNDYIFEEAKADGTIEKMDPKEYTRYLNNSNIITSARISRDYYEKLKKAHKIELKDGVIYFEIKNNKINIIKSVGKVSELDEDIQIDLIYENDLFYKDIYKKGELEYIKDNVKDKLFLKEMKSNVMIHESKLKNTKLEKINDTKNMLKKMKNDILLLELGISKKENKNSKKLVKKYN